MIEAPPPFGKRIVTINVEISGTDSASMVFGGKTYEFRDAFQVRLMLITHRCAVPVTI